MAATAKTKVASDVDNPFLVDTKDICFLCLKWVTNQSFRPSPRSKKENEVKTFSYRTLSRYLSLNHVKIFDVKSLLPCSKPPDLISKNERDFEVKLCQDCFILVSDFSKLYQDQERIRLQLYKFVQQIHDVMTQAGRVRSRVRHYKKAMTRNEVDIFNVGVMENLRKETMERCLYKVKKSMPRISLQKELNQTKKSRIPYQRKVESEDDVLPFSLSSYMVYEKNSIQNDEYMPPPATIQTSKRKSENKQVIMKALINGVWVTVGSETKLCRTENKSLSSSDKKGFSTTLSSKHAGKTTVRKGETKHPIAGPSWASGGIRTRRNSLDHAFKAKEEKPTKDTLVVSEEKRKAESVSGRRRTVKGRVRKLGRRRLTRKRKFTALIGKQSLRSVKKPLLVGETEKNGSDVGSTENKKMGEASLAQSAKKKRKNVEQNIETKSVTDLKKAKSKTPELMPPPAPPVVGPSAPPAQAVRGRGRPRKYPKPPVLQEPKIKPLKISLPRMARSVIGKYKRDRDIRSSRPQQEENKLNLPTQNPSTSDPPAAAPPKVLFGCGFCVMKFCTPTEVRRHCSKFHYCQLFFSSLKEPNSSDEDFKALIDSYFSAVVYRRRGRFVCPYCPKQYVQMSQLRGHVAMNHYQKLKDAVKQKNDEMKQKIKTKADEEVAKKKGLVQKSPETEPGTTSIQCEYCDKSFKKHSELRRHTARTHCNQLFASFKAEVSDLMFNAAIDEAFDEMLSLKSDPKKVKKCSLCPNLTLTSKKNLKACWRLHIINDHFQYFGNMLGHLQKDRELLKRRIEPGSSYKSEPVRTRNRSPQSEAAKIFSNTLSGEGEVQDQDPISKIPEYIQNIGNSVDKNGRRTDFYYCCLCKKTIDGIDKIEVHRRIHSKSMSPPRKSYQCKYCPMKFVSKRPFQTHSLERHSPQLLLPYKNPRVSEDSFPNIIEENFENMLQSGTLADTFKCNFCTWSVSSQVHKAEKQWRCHLVINHFEDVSNKLVELQKDKVHEEEGAKSKHLMNSPTSLPHQCNVCSAQFLHPSMLENHKKICRMLRVGSSELVDISMEDETPSTSGSATNYYVQLALPVQTQMGTVLKTDEVIFIPQPQPQLESESQDTDNMDITHHFSYNNSMKNENGYEVVESYEYSQLPVAYVLDEAQTLAQNGQVVTNQNVLQYEATMNQDLL